MGLQIEERKSGGVTILDLVGRIVGPEGAPGVTLALSLEAS